MSARYVVFIAACLAIFMVSVESTIIATAMPTIVGDLGGLRLFSWVFGIYFLTQAVTIPIYGRLADIYGRRTLIVVAVTIFLAGSILSGFSHTMLMLIVFRGLQGLGAGGVQPMATTIVGDLFPGKERAKVQGFMSSTWGISAILGPLIGAFLVEHAGWPTVFWINVPFGILCIAVVLRFFHENVEVRAHRIDYLGSALLALAVGTLMYTLVMGDQLAGLAVAGLAGAAIVAFVALLVHETRTPEPMLPLYLQRIRVIRIANAGNFAMGAVGMGVTAFLPTYVQGALGAPPVQAGAVLGVMSVAWTAGSIAGARLVVRTSYRTAAMTGGAFLVAGGVALVGLDPQRGVLWASLGSALLGLGFGFCNLVFMLSTQSAVGWEQRGAATSSNIFMRMMGQAIGTAACGAAFNLALYRTLPDAGDVVARMMDPLKRALLAPADVERYAAAIASSLHGIYLILGLASAAILALTLALPARLRPQDAPVRSA